MKVAAITTTEELFAFALQLDVPREAAEKLGYEAGIGELVPLLNDPLRAEEGTDELHEKLQPDEDGYRMLSAMLRAAATAPFPETFPEDVYFSTMRVFGRFVRVLDVAADLGTDRQDRFARIRKDGRGVLDPHSV